MKRLILGVFLFIISAQVTAQIIGIKVSPNLTLTDKQREIGGGLSAGFFYDQKIYKRLGISTGINYTQFRAVKKTGFVCLDSGSCTNRIDNIFSVLEVPIDLSINMNRDINNTKWVLLGNIGYSYGRLISNNAIVVYENGEIRKYDIRNLYGLHKSFPIAKIGVEMRKEITPKFIINFGGMYKYVGIYDKIYGKFNNWNLFLKVGYNLSRIHKE